MDKDLLKQELGSEGDLELKLVGGNLVLSVSHSSSGANANLNVSIKTDYFLDKLAAAIPGQIDDTIIALMKSALKS